MVGLSFADFRPFLQRKSQSVHTHFVHGPSSRLGVFEGTRERRRTSTRGREESRDRGIIDGGGRLTVARTEVDGEN